MKILFDRIDEPGLNTLPVYERRGGYESLRKALPDDARGGPGQPDGLGHPRARRRRVPDGPQDLVPAPRGHGQVPGVQRRRVRARDVQGPRDHAEEPAHADRGHPDRLVRRRDQPDVHLHPRRVRAPGRHPRGGDRRGRGRRVHRRADPRLRPLGVAGAPPRRRRVHLRRGDRPARLARGQARQPAAEAAVPGDRGPLPRADADQQRRDARDRAGDHPDGRQGVREARDRDVDRHQARVGLGRRPAARQLRDRARDPVARAHLRARRRPAGGPRDQVLVPRRLELAGADQGRPRPPVRLRLDGQGGIDARLGRDHRRSTTRTPCSRSR